MQRPSGLLWSNHHGTCYYGTAEEAMQLFDLIDLIDFCETVKTEKENPEENNEAGT